MILMIAQEGVHGAFMGIGQNLIKPYKK